MTTKQVSKLKGALIPEMANTLQEIVHITLYNVLVAHHDSVARDATTGVALAVTTVDATDLATLKTLILSLTNAMVSHGLDLGQHSAADANLDVPAGFVSHPAEPADLAECQATNNVLKIDLNAHLLNATPHRGVGGQGGFAPVAVSTADGSTQGTNETLVNALKAAFNLHIKSGIKTTNLLEP